MNTEDQMEAKRQAFRENMLLKKYDSLEDEYNSIKSDEISGELLEERDDLKSAAEKLRLKREAAIELGKDPNSVFDDIELDFSGLNPVDVEDKIHEEITVSDIIKKSDKNHSKIPHENKKNTSSLPKLELELGDLPENLKNQDIKQLLLELHKSL